MPRSVYSEAQDALVEILVSARKNAGLKQAELADRIGKDQSYISNIERGQRRVDTIEFYALARALQVDPTGMFKALVDRLPPDVEI